MIVTAALCFANESPRDLIACVKAIANIADRLVAVDGGYARWPNATAKSPGVQIAAISRAAKAAGLELIVHRPEELWAGQVAKRTFLLQEAAKGSDWIVVVDADHIITTDREAARAALEAMPRHVNSVAVDFFTPANPDRPIEESAATNWHLGLSGKTMRWSHIFRAFPDLRVEKKHWMYKTDIGQVEMRYGGKADADLGVPYTVEHRTLFRTEEQILAGRAFCNDRVKVVELTGQEDDQPGLPAPVWDYETMPYEAPNPTREGADGKWAPTSDSFSRETPNRVVTMGLAISGLSKGYPIAIVVRGISRRSETITFWPADRGSPGDVVVARFTNGAKAGTVLEVTKEGRHKIRVRHAGDHWARQVYGKMRGDAQVARPVAEPSPSSEPQQDAERA